MTITNPADTFIELHHAIGDAPIAAVALNLHRRVAVLEADQRIKGLAIAVLRWVVGSTAGLLLIEKLIKVVSP